MPKRGYRFTLDGTLLAIMALFLLGGLIALGFLQNLSKENRALIVFASSGAILVCFTSLISVSAFRKWLRKRVWLRAMAAWDESSRAMLRPNYVMVNRMGEVELRHLAIQVFSRMGYRIVRSEEDAKLLRLINPNEKFELFACQQGPDLLELHHVYSLYLEMKRTKAVRGYFWAPAGFTRESIHWAVHRSIVLADRYEIGRLVDCSHTKGLRFLEY
jgi:hypothetical protein